MKQIFLIVILIIAAVSPQKALAKVCDYGTDADGHCITEPPSGTGAFSANVKDFQDTIGMNESLDSVSGVINTLLPYLLTLAGLVLFAMIIMGGFAMMTAGTDVKKADAGKSRVTTAIIGFVIIFAAYWITQILEIVLGINILK